MSYATMDHAAWMERQHEAIRKSAAGGRGGICRRQLKDIPPGPLSEFQRKVVDIVGIVGGGIYNAPIADRIDWNYGGMAVAVIWKREMASFDFNQLTMLVFLCHEARIRCQIESAGPRQMRIAFWERKAAGDRMIRHPNLDEAVASFRKYLPTDHRIIYREAKPEDTQE